MWADLNQLPFRNRIVHSTIGTLNLTGLESQNGDGTCESGPILLVIGTLNPPATRVEEVQVRFSEFGKKFRRKQSWFDSPGDEGTEESGDEGTEESPGLCFDLSV
ncbi:hypothetical protein LXL04_019034 [Taraxacum kok-saghyz]